MTQPSTDYDWIREIKHEIKALDEIPLTGNAPPFPWEELSTRLAKSFERDGLEVKPGELTWRTKDQLFEGLGDSVSPLIFSVPSLKGIVAWVMPEQEMAVLESILLTKETHPITFQDKALSESFYRFLALETLYNFSQIAFDKTIAPVLTNEKSLPSEDSLTLDISLSLGRQTVWGRLIVSPDMRRAWVEHFTSHGPTQLSQKMKETIDLTVHLEAGKTHLTLSEWQAVNKGDFIVLDTCSLDSENVSEGRISLTINGRQAFRSKLKDGNLKILEIPLIQEVNTSMSKEQDEDDLSDIDLTEDEDLTSTTENGEIINEGAAPPIPKAQPASSAMVSKPSAAAAPGATSAKMAAAGEAVNPENIPITLTVEAGRIQMTVDRLMKLEPGNILELNVHPQDGVDLAINGKIVGKAELIRIGGTLGVRVMELGK